MSAVPLLGNNRPPGNGLGNSKKSVAAFSIAALCVLIVICELASFKNSGEGMLLGKMQYFYLPSNAIHFDPLTKQEVLSQEFADMTPMQMRIFSQGEILYELAPNQTEAPPGAIRSCAISSLVLQATLVINGWGSCGYMLEEADGLKMTNGTGPMPTSVISGPPNKTLCTPNMMKTKDCATKFTRTLYRNDPKTLQKCLGKVKGVSETCEAFKSCGPRQYSPSAANTAPQSTPSPAELKKNPPKLPGVCNTPNVGYFREVEVQRMCGICDMFDALMPKGFKSPSAKFTQSVAEEPPRKRRGGKDNSSELWLYLILIPLMLIFAAAVFFLCVQSTAKDTVPAQRLV